MPLLALKQGAAMNLLFTNERFVEGTSSQSNELLDFAGNKTSILIVFWCLYPVCIYSGPLL